MKQKDYVSFEVAKLLKEKGYDEPSKYYYRKGDNKFTYTALALRNSIEALYISECTTHPLAEVAKWLREVHNIHITIGNSASGYYWELSKADNGTFICDYNYKGSNDGGKYNTYEQALNEGIKEALNLL